MRRARLLTLFAAIATLSALGVVGSTAAAPDDGTSTTTVALPSFDDGDDPAAAETSSTLATTAPATTEAPTTAPEETTTTVPSLPVPATVPADPYAAVETPVIGRILMPSIGVDHEILEGVTLTAIDQGPGHWPGTAVPGGYGNAVFGGHRTTHSAPFNDVDLLELGDEIVFEMTDGSRHVYRVTEQFVVDPAAMWIVDQAPGHTVTLFACHPKGSAAQRIVTRGELVESTPTV